MRLRELAFRAEGRAGDQRDVVAPLGKKLAGDQRVLLRPAHNQPGYDVNDLQWIVSDCQLTILSSRLLAARCQR